MANYVQRIFDEDVFLLRRNKNFEYAQVRACIEGKNCRTSGTVRFLIVDRIAHPRLTTVECLGDSSENFHSKRNYNSRHRRGLERSKLDGRVATNRNQNH